MAAGYWFHRALRGAQRQQVGETNAAYLRDVSSKVLLVASSALAVTSGKALPA